MERIPEAEVERLMRVREVMLQAMAKKITWWQAAEILGVSPRTMRRWKWQYDRHGFRGIGDQRKWKPSWRKVPMEEVDRVLRLYREQYFDLNVRHFHEKLRDQHEVNWSYTWVKNVLQGAELDIVFRYAQNAPPYGLRWASLRQRPALVEQPETKKIQVRRSHTSVV